MAPWSHPKGHLQHGSAPKSEHRNHPVRDGCLPEIIDCYQYRVVRARLYLRERVEKHSVRIALQVIACENDINLPTREKKFHV